jgi:fatty acid desaturase
MKLFRYKIDRLPVAIFTGIFILDLTLFFTVENRWMVFAYYLMSFWPKANICAWNHHHQHCSTFTKPSLNLLLEIIFGFQTGVTSKGWLLHHNLGHHQTYLDQTKDEAGWKTKSGKTMGPVRYMLEVAGTRYYRSFRVGLRYPKHLNHFVLVMILHVSLLLLGASFNGFNTFFIFLLPMINGLLITSWANHSQHAGLDTQNDYEASRNIMDPTFNLLTGNLGYHTSHHINQGLHWSKLPQHHATIKHLIPASCYVNAGFPYSVISKITEQSPLDMVESAHGIANPP